MQKATTACAVLGAAMVTFTVAKAAMGLRTEIARTVFGPIRAARILKQKREEIDGQIAAALEWCATVDPIARELEDTIAGLSASELVALQKGKKVTATQLLVVFVKRAVVAHNRTNCLVWIDITDAIADAKAADALCGSGASLGALHGLPISIKDNINVRNSDSTLGMLKYAFKPHSEDAALVKQIKRAGGIVFAKTNIPQTLVAYECLNHVFGTCKNPVNTDFACGGSSGGEGAIVKMAGSVIGIGTDIGGSIRIPAHFCGVCGIKPSQWRVPAYGITTPMAGQEAVCSVAGPLARSVDDLVTMMRVLLNGSQAVDGNTTNIGFRDAMYEQARTQTSGLVFGYYDDDGFAPASPACKRALQMAIAALEKQGHTCVKFEPAGLGLRCVGLMYGLLSADGGKTLKGHLGTEPLITPIKGLFAVAAIPYALKKATAWFFRNVRGDASIAAIFDAAGERTVQEYWRLHHDRQLARAEAAQAMQNAGIDAILCPGLATPAVPHGASAQVAFGAMMTGLLNVLDMPSVTVPVTTVDASVDEWNGPPVRAPVIEGRIRGMYDATKGHGLPVGVQIYGMKSADEALLGYAHQLEAALTKA